jgi:hypothetical protein
LDLVAICAAEHSAAQHNTCQAAKGRGRAPGSVKNVS